MHIDDKIYVAGHQGLVGSAIIQALRSYGYNNIITRTHSELDLTRQIDVETFFAKEKPDYVFLAAAKVGGINANNTYPAEFIYVNLAIQCNVIHCAYKNKAKKLIFLGSGCIYPREAVQPIKEDYLLTGPLEKTNEAYAIAKIAGLKMCEFYNRQYGTDYISCMPANLYGTSDNFNLNDSHVVPALIRKICEAKERGDRYVTIWGTGSAYREFLHVDDMADACVFLMENHSGNEPVNIGMGSDITIMELAKIIAQIADFKGKIETDPSKPDGTPRKLLDSGKLLAMGWKPKISLIDGLRMTYEDYLKNRDRYRK
jgi:GDP-L-fucose synthase